MKYLFFIFLLFSLWAEAQVSFNIDSVMVWRDLEKSNGLENFYNEIWGFEQNGDEYAVLGSRDGAYIINISNVRKPELVKFIPGTYDLAVNRDYHDYNGYLYMVCDQGPSTLQIVDLHYLPDSLPVIYDSDELIINCHNIFIDSITERLHACGVTIPDTGSGKRVDMQVYDISNSYIPELILTIDEDKEFHDIYVENDTAYANRGRSGLIIFDFSEIINDRPKVLWPETVYSEGAYNHSGYASVDGEYYFMGHETNGIDLMSIKINDFDEPDKVKNFNSGKNPESIIAHNLLVRDSLLFVSYYHEGLQVFDISNGSDPIKVGHYQTFTRSFGDPPMKDYSAYDGAWGVYPYLPSGYIIVSDRAKGLFIFDISDIDGNTHPELLPRRTIFPNPAQTYLDIVHPPEDVIKIEIFDVNGRLIESTEKVDEYKNITRYTFRSNLVSGIYLIKVEGKGDTFVERFVKE